MVKDISGKSIKVGDRVAFVNAALRDSPTLVTSEVRSIGHAYHKSTLYFDGGLSRNSEQTSLIETQDSAPAEPEAPEPTTRRALRAHRARHRLPPARVVRSRPEDAR